MSRIDKLIQKFCPEGVVFKTLEELGSFYGGLTGKSKVDFQNGNSKFISYMNVYSNIAVNTQSVDYVSLSENENQNKIQIGDVLFTGSSETPDECGMSSVLTQEIDEPLYLNSFCFGFRLDDAKLFLPDFLKYHFRSDEARKQISQTASGVTRFNISKKRFGKISIPIPPLPIQEEIVSILDKFIFLEAELEAELEARKKQYEHYRDHLLSIEGKKVEWKTLEEIGEFTRGKRFVKTDLISTGVPCIHYGEMYTHYRIWAKEARSFLAPELAKKLRSAKRGDVIIVAAGETIEDIGQGVAWHGDEEIVIHDACFAYSHKMYPNYVAHFLQTDIFHSQIKRNISSGKISSINAAGLGKAKIPVPPKAEQKRIADILDKFDALVNDISIGLPAEIEARKKQYEYYRNRLLTFKKAGNE